MRLRVPGFEPGSGSGLAGMVSVRMRKAEEEEGKAEFSVFHSFRQPGDSKKH